MPVAIFILCEHVKIMKLIFINWCILLGELSYIDICGIFGWIARVHDGSNSGPIGFGVILPQAESGFGTAPP